MVAQREKKSTDTHLYQCVRCGNIKSAYKQEKIIDDIYYNIYCPHCNASTFHLDVGNGGVVDYSLYDSFLDERYFIYENKTK